RQPTPAVGQATTTVVNPMAGVWIPLTVVRGQPLTQVVATFTDATSTGDPTAYTATIDWGEGTVTLGKVTANTNGGFNVAGLGDHFYAAAGQHTASVTIDKPGLATLTVYGTATAVVAAMQPDPVDSTKTALVVGGSSGADQITLRAATGRGAIQVTIASAG